MNQEISIGVLALQGDVVEHYRALQRCIANISQFKAFNLKAIEVRTAADLRQVHGLIIPGGESTTIGKLLELYGLGKLIAGRVKDGMPVYGTCAGAILLSTKIIGHQKAKNLELIDITIRRNAYGAQLDSFITNIEVAPEVTPQPLQATFIRAPRIEEVSAEVQVLATHEDYPVLVREKNVLVSTFHPELNDLSLVHKYFIEMAIQFASKKASLTDLPTT